MKVVGSARAMIKHCKKVEGLGDAVDIVRTGGDGANTVNISTGSSILAAACGARVAKASLVNYNHNHFYLSLGFS
ncbi:putative anthranilate phosphoribosyltransferase [Helianthus debilis subsp. tardiflorus]